MTQQLSYSINTACDATSYSRSYLYVAIKEGRLKTFKRGQRTFILAEELERFIKEEAGHPAAA